MFKVRTTLGIAGLALCFTIALSLSVVTASASIREASAAQLPFSDDNRLQVVAQTRRLPPTNFPFNSSSPSTPLPHVNGVHLSEGEDRPNNAPAQVYNPGEPTAHFQLVRWDIAKMPLKVWISPGLKLPDVPFDQLQATRVDTVTQLLNAPDGLKSLEIAPGWTEHTNEMVAAGIEQWREFRDVGIQYVFVDDPHDAQIMVFYTDAFRDADSAGGIAVGGVTSAQIYPVAQARSIKIKQKPVVIEISTRVNSSDERLMGASAHEFGHALGIKAHSDKRQDIMFRDRIANYLSSSDKATIRYLYSRPPQWVM